MSRDAAISAADAYFESGRFEQDLARRVGIATESQNPERAGELHRYLAAELSPTLEKLGFVCRLLDNRYPDAGGFLYAERIEDSALPTVLSYGHGDVIRGQEAQWRSDLSPWRLTQDGNRLYGRGTADNKGQHTINIAALEAVIAARGRLGFNCKLLIETGEEIGSLGLRELCQDNRELLSADVFIASDGPRIGPERPTLFLGSRGALNFDLTVDMRDGAHHSGNWGGLLANPGIVLAHALASITTASGKILVTDWLPKEIPEPVRALLSDLSIESVDGGPRIDDDWGEPGLSAAEKVYGWTAFEVLAFKTGNPDHPVNAIPGRATAHCQIRYVVGVDPDRLLPALRTHLDDRGFSVVEIKRAERGFFVATRTSPDNPWVRWAADSLARSTGKKPAILPNLGGSLPNDIFSQVLGLPTVWVPHSYPSCSQHAPNEHILVPVVQEGLRLMAGLFWDLGENPPERSISQ